MRLLAVVAAAVLVAAGAGWASAHLPTETGRASGLAALDEPARVLTAAEWKGVLAELDAARGRAFDSPGVPALLDDVYAELSSSRAVDAAAQRRLLDRGLRAVGMRTVVSSVRVLRSDGEGAVLRVVDTRPAYDLVDGSGAVVEHVPARGRAEWVVGVARSKVGWRVVAVLSPRAWATAVSRAAATGAPSPARGG